MASMSSRSEQDSEEQWDDMAIVRAFEEALSDQRSRGRSTDKASSRRQKAAARPNGEKVAESVSIREDDDDDFESNEASASAMLGAWGQNAAQPQHLNDGNPLANQRQPQQPSQQSPQDLYQAAYAQAYAQLQAQFQAGGAQAESRHAAPTQPRSNSAQMPAFHPQPTYYSPSASVPTPPMPSTQMPFPTMPRAVPTNSPDDGLANLLLSWYQSGYYTGRFQAMQEMKMRGQR